jgi:iron-sulfur cluster assembly accessory protein
MSSCSGCPSDQSKVQDIAEEDRPAKKKGITVTKSAAKFISDISSKQGKKGWGLRLEVIPGGCAGYKYFMGFQEKAAKEDQEMKMSGIKLIVDEESLELLDGSEIDYTDSLEASGLKINNPNATRGCGCGKSFA